MSILLQSPLDALRDYVHQPSVSADNNFKEGVNGARKYATERLEELGLQYSGVSATAQYNRATHCYNCKRELTTQTHLGCNNCSWILCDCGACGCGFNR